MGGHGITSMYGELSVDRPPGSYSNMRIPERAGEVQNRFTDITKFPKPMEPRAVMMVAALEDLYVDPDCAARLHAAWHGSVLRVLDSRKRRGTSCKAHGASEDARKSEAATGLESSLFRSKQRLTFLGITLGYAMYYMTRLSFTYVAPTMVKELGMEITQVGAITSIFSLAYAFSKLLGGVLGDLFSPRQVFALGLLVIGCLNIAFGLSSSVALFGLLWGLNGVFQGTATPQCAKLMTNWLPLEIRGRWWAVWNTSHNLGGFAIPILAGSAAVTLGWRYGLFISPPGSTPDNPV
ncbi:hypothetical protein CYMTET_20478 [Cymbomonas tetramitiformis]|uniref:Major facilitator superfamily (MFS) profile domain-containing protein n=1 Tax=Cymbomonas tetramitiformis TaxID=36881 RepID=A0AAE0G438_9CHLO|nr:hypothetical protein CYMTET_20478 [Cymbomonas tetramitiformis]